MIEVTGLIYLIAVILMSILLILVYKLHQKEGNPTICLCLAIVIFAPQAIIYIKAVLCFMKGIS